MSEARGTDALKWNRRGFMLRAAGVGVSMLTPRIAVAASPPIRGIIRVCGSTQMRPLIDAWARAFRQRHPDVSFDIDLKGTATAQFGLHMGTADIALSGRQIYPYEYYGIYRRSQLLTVEIPVAIGSYDHVGRSAALAVFVHPHNPLTRLTLPQLDRIFGAERAGGWQRMEWNTQVARRVDCTIRKWGQLGLTSAWSDAPIVPYGPPALYPGGVSFFQSRVMGGADTWNEGLREYPDRADMLRALSADRYGIGYASLGYAIPGVKPLMLAERDGGPFYALNVQTVASNTYPLSRFAYMYLAPDTVSGDHAPLSPRLQAFLAFVLSPEGQRLIPPTGYFRLPPVMAAEHARKVAINALPEQAEADPAG